MSVSTISIGILISLLAAVPIIIKSTDKPNQTNEINENDKNEGSFKVLSYNIAGLWELISESHPKKYIQQISPKLNDYDIVNIQENFAYNKELNSKLTFKYKTDFTGNVPFGDGLMTLSKYPIYNYDRVGWDKIYGVDAPTKRGFSFTSIELKSGYFIDIYNLHTDAFDDKSSIKGRNSNLEQISKYIQGISEGKAVIVYGDTNSLYTHGFDKILDLLIKPCNLSDAWVEKVMGGKYPEQGPDLDPDNLEPNLKQKGEVLDKILYRSGKNVEIEVTSFKILFEEFTDEEGNQLSDHYPITADIKYRLIEGGILTSDLYGQSKGEGFSFIGKMDGNYPSSITISSISNRIIKVGFSYQTNGKVTVGRNEGNEKVYEFKDGEYITKMTVCKNRKLLVGPYHISYIKLTTNLNNIISAGQFQSLNQKTFEAPEGYSIAGFIGYYSDFIHKIGCVYQKI